MKPSLLFLVGPTAIGKSSIAFYLARRLNAEIISCDSMQVYKGMDIISSFPPKELTKSIRHHLIGMIKPTVAYNVSRYRKEAQNLIKEVLAKGKIPLFVGGTGLYMSVLLEGIFESGAENTTIRKKLYIQAQEKGSIYLYKKLERIDPEAARKIHHHDTRRIVRALEIFEATGKPISILQKQRKGLWDDYDIRIFCLNMARDQLKRRIDQRVDKMFSDGLVKEVSRLLKLRLSRTARYAIGIKELKGYFAGRYSLDEAKRMMKCNTRLYARRQLTWFRKDRRIEWIDVGKNEGPVKIAERLWKRLYSSA